MRNVYDTYQFVELDADVIEVFDQLIGTVAGFITRGRFVDVPGGATVISRGRWFVVGCEYLSFSTAEAAAAALIDHHVDRRMYRVAYHGLERNDGWLAAFRHRRRRYLTPEGGDILTNIMHQRRDLLAEFARRSRALRPY